MIHIRQLQASLAVQGKSADVPQIESPGLH